jgi:hypothetical protein
MVLPYSSQVLLFFALHHFKELFSYIQEFVRGVSLKASANIVFLFLIQNNK